MRTINFTEDELENLIQFYEDEVDAAVEYLHQMNKILTKLTQVQKTTVKGAKVGSKAAIVPAKKRGRKPAVNLEPSILGTLQPKALG